MSDDFTKPAWLLVLPWDLHHPGGVNQVVANLFDQLAQSARFRPVLMVKSWTEPTPVDSVEQGRATIHARLRSPWGPTSGMRHLIAWLVSLVPALRRMAAMVREHDVRVVNVHYPDLDSWLWIFLRGWLRDRKLSVMLSFHGRDLRHPTESSGLGRVLWRQLLLRADAVTACSATLARELAHSVGLPSESVSAIDNGIDVGRILTVAEAEPRDPLPADYVLALGTLEYKKGHDVLMRAFERIASAHPGLHLLIAGRTGPANEVAELEEVRRSLPAAPRISVRPDLAHEEALRMLARARVLVLASRVEPFGIVVLEAGVLSRPVIATDICGVVRRVDAPDEIVSVPPDDVDALARAIDALLRDQASADLRAKAFRARVVRDFQWNRILELYVSAARAP